MILLMVAAGIPRQVAETEYLVAAKQAATWIRSELKKSIEDRMLYSGTPGVILFLIEAFQSTGDKSYLVDANRLGDDLAANIEKTQSSGLYTGLAGMAFSLNELGKVGPTKYKLAGRRCIDLIERQAEAKGGGVEWREGYDIISGSAGIGCFLLYAAKEMHESRALQLAKRAGDRLLEVAMHDDGGLKWGMADTEDMLMPNLSHGAAGVAYFLARLYEQTKDARYLEAAKAGADYLIKASNADGLIFHNDRGGQNLYYLGWCHGPVGTSRLFAVLHRITKEKRYGEWIDRAAATLLKSGIPEKQTAGFWNNVGQCCGSAGVGEFFLDIYQFDRKPEQIAFARRVTADLLKRATLTREDPGSSGPGLKWIQAEHRVQPDNVQAQIGLMQGAAGIGLWLLHMDAQERHSRPRIYLPDNPFRGRH